MQRALKVRTVHNLIPSPLTRLKLRALGSSPTFPMANSIPKDVRDFLDCYPGAPNDPKSTANHDFYANKIPCRPDRLLIDDLHEQ